MQRSYHAGELALQTESHSLEQAAKLTRTVKSSVPDPLSRFLPTLPWILIGAAADDGRVWASAVFGPPGFLQSHSGATVEIDAHPDAGDPLNDLVGAPQPRGVGLLAIDLSRRMRARINGRTIAERGQLTVAVEECYANCPKYIHRRNLATEGNSAGMHRQRADRIPDAWRALIDTADTMFIATVGPGDSADVSHRGGPRGFLECSPDGRVVRFEDLPGNGVFNTMGNLQLDHRAGVTIVGFNSGETLQLSGHARLIGNSNGRRLVEFTVESARHAANAPFVCTPFVEPTE